MKVVQIIWRVILLLLLVGLLALLGTCVVQTCVQPKGKAPPSAEDAPFEIQVTGRTIYGRHVVQTPESITISGYWEWDKDRWVYRPISITLERQVFGKITVKRR